MTEAFSSPDQSPAAEQGSTLRHPAEVLGHPAMSQAEKRAVLASWASDARAVADAPALRRLDSGAVVAVADILHALRSLDAGQAAGSPHRVRAWRPPLAPRRGRLAAGWRGKGGRRARPGDDDPPPCPAVIALPPRPTFTAACADRAGR